MNKEETIESDLHNAKTIELAIERNDNALKQFSNAIEAFCDNASLNSEAWKIYKNKLCILNTHANKYRHLNMEFTETIKRANSRMQETISSYNGPIDIPKSSFDISNEIGKSNDEIKRLNDTLKSLEKDLYTSKYVELYKDAKGQAVYGYTDVLDEMVKRKMDEVEQDIKDYNEYIVFLYELISVRNEEADKILNIKSKFDALNSELIV